MIRKTVLEMSVYKPPLEGRSAENYLLLDFNERTVPVSHSVKQALIDYINTDRLQQYPEYGNVAEEVAAYAGVRPENLMLTNGSDQGIDIIYRLVAEPEDEAIVPAPTFPMLSHSARLCGMKVLEPVYTMETGYPLQEVLRLISPKTKVIVVCNPNSPTGTLLQPENVAKIAAAAPHAAILVDECYYEYSRTTVKDRITELPNLFITRTFSKTFGIPSLRLGYLMSSAENINNLLKVRGPYDINRMAIIAISAALKNPRYMEDYVNEVVRESMPALLEFLARKGIRYWPTVSNFVLFYPPDDAALTRGLQERKILVRPRSGPGIEGTVRINVGTLAQTEELIAALEDLL